MAESEASSNSSSSFRIDEFAMAARWLEQQHQQHHHRHRHRIEDHSDRAIVGAQVYEELERYWEDVADQQLAAEQEGRYGRDMGGELYRKSREMAMRRRLLFDCVNQVLRGMVGALVKEAIAIEPAGYGRSSSSRENTRRWRRSREWGDAVSVWRRIEAMASSTDQKIINKQAMQKQSKKKKEAEEQEEREGAMEELLHLLMAMDMKQEEGLGDGDGDGEEDEGDEVVAMVAGAVEGEILDSIVYDLLT
jgi:hypothetical protein